jgi:hypothetical protein
VLTVETNRAVPILINLADDGLELSHGRMLAHRQHGMAKFLDRDVSRSIFVLPKQKSRLPHTSRTCHNTGTGTYDQLKGIGELENLALRQIQPRPLLRSKDCPFAASGENLLC